MHQVGDMDYTQQDRRAGSFGTKAQAESLLRLEKKKIIGLGKRRIKRFFSPRGRNSWAG